MSSTLASRFDLEELAASEPHRFQYHAEGGAYLNLRGVALEPLPEIDESKTANLCRVVRGLAFAAVDAAQSGHPGGSSSKAEMVLSLLLSGRLGFDAWNPKHPGRSRVVWSAGHCTPLFHGLVSLVYEALRRKGFTLPGPAAKAAVYPEQLAGFRRWGGPSGHVESQYALADTSTGSSGHGFSAASVNYGGPLPKDVDDFLQAACPVVGSYGGKSRWEQGVADQLEQALQRALIPHDVKEYPEAGHSFMNNKQSFFFKLLRYRNIGFNEPAAMDARRRIIAFFNAHLGG